jgi:hypothetical protein
MLLHQSALSAQALHCCQSVTSITARLILLIQHLEPGDILGQLGVILTKSEVIRGKARRYTNSKMYNYMLSRHCPMKK